MQLHLSVTFYVAIWQGLEKRGEDLTHLQVESQKLVLSAAESAELATRLGNSYQQSRHNVVPKKVRRITEVRSLSQRFFVKWEQLSTIYRSMSTFLYIYTMHYLVHSTGL